MGDKQVKTKPRQLRGTPAYNFRTKIALYILAAAVSFGVAFNYLPVVQKAKGRIAKDFFTKTEEENDRRILMTSSFIKQRTAKEIEAIQEAEKKMSF